MAEKPEKRDYKKLKIAAEGMFITQGMTSRDIADTLDISEVTISRWRQAEEWDDKRSFIKATPSRLREALIREAERVVGGEATTINADAVAKLLSAADKLASRATPDVVYSVLSDFLQYTATVDSEAAASLSGFFKMFLQHKIENDG